MTTDMIQTLGKWLTVVLALGGCFYVIVTAPQGTDVTQAWLTIGVIVGWIVRDAAGTSATTNAVKIAAAQNPPTYTST